MSSLKGALTADSAVYNWLLSFFKRWPSSMMRPAQLTPRKNLLLLSSEADSYETTTIWHLRSLVPSGYISYLYAISRACEDPKYATTRNEGAHCLISRRQLAQVELGTTITKGKQLCSWTKVAMKPMTWMVLPRPISSARIPFFWLYHW